MAVTETIQELLQGIDDAQYGRDMRQYIHKGIQKCYEEGSAGETDLTARDQISDLESDFTTLRASVADQKSSLIADVEMQKGEYFMFNNRLYRTITHVPQGVTMYIGTNIKEVSLASELGSIGVCAKINFEETTQNANFRWIDVGNYPNLEIPGTFIVTVTLQIGRTSENTNCGVAVSTTTGSNFQGGTQTEIYGDGYQRTLTSTFILTKDGTVGSTTPLYLKALNGNVSTTFSGSMTIMRINNGVSALI